MRRKVLLALLLAITVSAAVALDDDDPVEKRVREVAALVVAKPSVPDELFGKAFLSAVPASKVAEILAQMHKQSGKVVSTKRLSGNRLSGKFELLQERGARTECTIGVSEKEPHRIETLLLRPLGVAAKDFRDLEHQLAKLPGKVSFAVARLSSTSRTTLASLAPDEILGIGSSFKLYVLGRLIQDVNEGRRRFSDVVPLDALRRSLPSGMLQGWPEGAPVTLHTLASFMISISDNTATDSLIGVLGRERIERHMADMGASFPDRSTPFLTTGELFRLKWGKPGAVQRYLAADRARRRALLDEIDREPLPAVGAVDMDRPTAISELEWFASANDLVRALDWIRRATESDRAARGILAINDGGLVPDKKAWRWIGFKGGSEPGVLELAWLLERQDGAWFAVCAGWNDPDDAVELATLGGIATRAMELLASFETPRLY
jgi:beta-lactamase class A